MKKGEWTFLSNHGRVLAYIASHANITNQGIAFDAGLSVGGVQKIVAELVNAGYLERMRIGRRNHYRIHPELPMRHHLESNHPVGKLLAAVGCSLEQQQHDDQTAGLVCVNR
jgi:hypothetical protein